MVKREKARINVTFDKELLEQADEYAAKMHQNRSGFISMCVATYISQQEMMASLPELLRAYNKGIEV